MNPVLCRISLPGTNTSARYSGDTDDISGLVSSRAEFEEARKEIRGNETVTGTKIKHDRFVSLQLGT